MEVARREKRKPLIRLSDVQKERAAYWLQPPFVLTEPKPTFLNLRVRRRIKGRQLEPRPATWSNNVISITWTHNRDQIGSFDSSSMTYGKLAANSA
jgi:hypothetical protein